MNVKQKFSRAVDAYNHVRERQNIAQESLQEVLAINMLMVGKAGDDALRTRMYALDAKPIIGDYHRTVRKAPGGVQLGDMVSMLKGLARKSGKRGGIKSAVKAFIDAGYDVRRDIILVPEYAKAVERTVQAAQNREAGKAVISILRRAG